MNHNKIMHVLNGVKTQIAHHYPQYKEIYTHFPGMRSEHDKILNLLKSEKLPSEMSYSDRQILTVHLLKTYLFLEDQQMTPLNIKNMVSIKDALDELIQALDEMDDIHLLHAIVFNKRNIDSFIAKKPKEHIEEKIITHFDLATDAHTVFKKNGIDASAKNLHIYDKLKSTHHAKFHIKNASIVMQYDEKTKSLNVIKRSIKTKKEIEDDTINTLTKIRSLCYPFDNKLESKFLKISLKMKHSPSHHKRELSKNLLNANKTRMEDLDNFDRAINDFLKQKKIPAQDLMDMINTIVFVSCLESSNSEASHVYDVKADTVARRLLPYQNQISKLPKSKIEQLRKIKPTNELDNFNYNIFINSVNMIIINSPKEKSFFSKIKDRFNTLKNYIIQSISGLSSSKPLIIHHTTPVNLKKQKEHHHHPIKQKIVFSNNHIQHESKNKSNKPCHKKRQ